MAASPLVVGIDGRELAGRPTGTGRYLRNLLRHWRETGDTLVVYFNGPPALDPVLDHAHVRKRALGDGCARGLFWQEWLLPRAARADALDVFFSPAYSCPLRLELAARHRRCTTSPSSRSRRTSAGSTPRAGARW